MKKLLCAALIGLGCGGGPPVKGGECSTPIERQLCVGDTVFVCEFGHWHSSQCVCCKVIGTVDAGRGIQADEVACGQSGC